MQRKTDSGGPATKSAEVPPVAKAHRLIESRQPAGGAQAVSHEMAVMVEVV